MSKDFSSKVRKAAKKASNNGKCWWVERFILNSYLWRGPDKLKKYELNPKEQSNEQEEKNDLQRTTELCELP